MVGWSLKCIENIDDDDDDDDDDDSDGNYLHEYVLLITGNGGTTIADRIFETKSSFRAAEYTAGKV